MARAHSPKGSEAPAEENACPLGRISVGPALPCSCFLPAASAQGPWQTSPPPRGLCVAGAAGCPAALRRASLAQLLVCGHQNHGRSLPLCTADKWALGARLGRASLLPHPWARRPLSGSCWQRAGVSGPCACSGPSSPFLASRYVLERRAARRLTQRTRSLREMQSLPVGRF